MVNFYLEENHFVFELNNENNDLQKFYTPEYFEFLGIDIEIFSNNIAKMNGGSYQEGTELTIPYKYFANFIDVNLIKKKEDIEPQEEDSVIPMLENENSINSIENDNISIEKSVTGDSVEEPIEEEPMIMEEEPVIMEEKSVIMEEEPVIMEEKSMIMEEEPLEEAVDDSVVEETEIENVIQENVVSVKNILMLKIEIDNDNKTINGILRDIMMSNKEKNEDNIQLNTDGLFYEDIERIYMIKNYLNMEVYQDEVFRINGKFIILKENSTEPTENISGLDVSMMNNTYLTNKLRR
jgi:hypothetical protein